MKSILLLTLLATSQILFAEDVIYSNRTNDQGTSLIFNDNNLTAAGSAVTFGGTSRFLTGAEFQIYNASPSIDTFTATTLSLYNVAGNILGSLIGSYTLAPATYLANTVATLTFVLPFVAVPNDIVWTLAFADNSNLGLNYFAGPPTVGSSSDTQAWWDSGAGPTLTPFPAGGEAYYSAFSAEAATPEPTTWILIGGGLAAVLLRRRAARA